MTFLNVLIVSLYNGFVSWKENNSAGYNAVLALTLNYNILLKGSSHSMVFSTGEEQPSSINSVRGKGLTLVHCFDHLGFIY